MNDKPAKNPDATENRARSAASLQTELALRERQLRDLTEQALTFLEELAETRRVNADRDQLAARVGQLEHLLGEARRRLRHAGGIVGEPAGTAGERPTLEVVFFGAGALADAVASMPALAGLGATWIGGPGERAATDAPAALQLLAHSNASTPAQCVNLGMLATKADVVLFLGPGVRLLRPPALPTTLPPDAALLSPRLGDGDDACCGCEERDGLLHLVPHRVPDAGAELPPIPWPTTRAFAVRRAAFERLGMFDEGLSGDGAILDYALRARDSNLAVYGLGSIATAITPGDAAAPAPLTNQERLQLLAAHRPAALGLALSRVDDLWSLGDAGLPALLASLLARLPENDAGARRALMEQVAIGLAQHTLPTPEFCVRLRQLRETLLRGLAAHEAVLYRGEIKAALQRVEAEATGAPIEAPAAAVAALAQDVELARRCAVDAAVTLQNVVADRAALDVDRHAHMARSEQAEGARAATQKQLDQVETWLREAQADQKALNAALTTTASERTHFEHQVADLTQRLELRRLEVQELRTALSASSRASGLDEHASHEQLHRRLAELARDAGDLAELRRRFDRIEELAGARQREVQDLQQAVAARDQTLAARDQAIAARDQTIAELQQTVADLQRIAAARDQVMADLLGEIRRWRVFPRRLEPHELALLERLGRKP